MKILFASTPATGHINPLLAITRILLAEGHDIAFLTGTAFRSRIESSGARFSSFPFTADFDPNDILSIAPELDSIPPGIEWLRIAFERIFVDAIPAQHQGLQQTLASFPADIIIGDDLLFGALPMLLGPRTVRPPIALCGTSVLHWAREDGAPNFLGLPPAGSAEQRAEYAAVARRYDEALDQPVLRRLNQILEAMDVGPISVPMFHSVVELADAYLQLSVPSFEFPRKLPPSVHFVGTPAYVLRAAQMAQEFASIDTRSKILSIISQLAENRKSGLGPGDFQILASTI